MYRVACRDWLGSEGFRFVWPRDVRGKEDSKST